MPVLRAPVLALERAGSVLVQARRPTHQAAATAERRTVTVAARAAVVLLTRRRGTLWRHHGCEVWV